MVVFAVFFHYGDVWKDASAKTFLAQELPLILMSKSEDELLKRASPELRSFRHDALERSFSDLQRLGRLLRYEGAEGHAEIFSRDDQADALVASYTARARFEHGEAQIAVGLIRQRGQWQFTSFTITSSGFS